ncbi:MAG: AI-2E family transporter [Heliobacteriaceae bacterium]|jgi:predicted PurR-regulated permease PerM|nr:AI-2E family transporter [Heliobacteriaceae bacterium]
MFKKLRKTENIIFLILIAGLLFLIPQITEIVLMFFAAYVIACALNPFVAALQKRTSRTLASACVVSLSALSVVALFAPIFFVAFKEIKTFITFFPEKLAQIVKSIVNFKLFGQDIADLINLNSVINSSAGFTESVVNHSWNFTVNLFQFIVIIIAMLMIVYYVLVDKDYLKDKFIEFFPAEIKDKARAIIDTISLRVGGYVRIQILSMASVGFMMAIVLAVLGVDYPIFLGLITGTLDIIPLLGPAIALALTLLVAYPLGAVKIILIIVSFLVVQQLSNYIVRPILFGRFMALHPLMIFLALFMAEKFLGFWGVILSPAIAATVCVLIDELYLRPINHESLNSLPRHCEEGAGPTKQSSQDC